MSSNPPSYEKPEWSSLPNSTEYALEVLKQGVIADEIPLRDREYFLVGRQLDRVHIPAEHQSISRIHAVLNFRNDGALMLRDLGSAQGTFLNKAACSKDTYYRLKVGDMIKFGASTRYYIVKGPSEDTPIEYDSENLRRLRREAEEREEAARKKKEEQDFVGSAWGMSFDDYTDQTTAEQSGGDKDDEDNERFRSGDKRAALPDYLRKDEHYDRKYGDKFEADIKADEIHNKKDEEILEKIRKKERKIQNMQEEIRRIYLKEQSQDEGLTEGQLAAVARNDKAIEQLSVDIEGLVKQIRDKNVHRDAINSKVEAGHKRVREEQDDDDDLLDTTAQTADASTNWRLKKKLNKLSSATHDANCSSQHSSNNGGALTYQEIKKSFEDTSGKLAKAQEELTSATAKVQSLQLQLVHSSIGTGKLDDIDRVIIQDEIKEAQHRLKTVNMERDQLQVKVRNLQKLMTAAAPTLKSSTTTATSSSSSTVPNTNLSPPIVKIVKPEAKATIDQSVTTTTSRPSNAAAMPPPPSTADVPAVPQTETFSNDDSKDYHTNRLIALQDFKKFVEEEKKRAVAEKSQEIVKKPDEGKKTNAEDLSAFERSLQAAAYGDLEVESAHSSSHHATSSTHKKPKGPDKLAFLVHPDDEAQGHSAPRQFPSTVTAAAGDLEGGDYVWVPPKQQKGDGRTSLNDKFGY